MKLRSTFYTIIPLLLVVPTSATSAAEPSTWPQWRGPNRDCRVSSKTIWPTSVSGETLKTVWRSGYGPSYSGPIVSKDHVFITETRNRKLEVVRALDRKTGKQIWKTEWSGAMSVPFFARSNGDWIRATPAFDGERLYVAGMRDVLICLDASNGKELWRVDFVKQYKSKLPAFGFVSSPLLDGDAVYVQAGGGLVRLNKLTGKVIWHKLKDGGGMFGSAFSSPVIATIREKKQLVVQTRQTLAGVDLKSGNTLWSVRIPAFRGMNILTPTVIGNRVFTSSYGGGSFLFDVDNSAAGGWSVKQVWRSKVQGYMSSPVVIDGYIYLHLRNQRFTCLKLSDGSIQWTTQPFGKYWSMAVQGKQILALDQRGELLLIKANPDKFELVDRRKISEESTWAHLAVCDSQLFVRGLKSMSVLNWKSK